jgi:hypothetical protein
MDSSSTACGVSNLLGPMIMGAQTGPFTNSSRSFKITKDDGDCLIQNMPSGGPSVMMTKGPGNATSACAQSVYPNTTSCVPAPDVANLKKKGDKFANTLLGQAIALSLNLRLSPGLANLVINGNTFNTVKSLDCTTQGKNTKMSGASTVGYNIPTSVINYLGSGKTIGDILALGNAALAGIYKPVASTDPTLTEITGAMGAINEGFDECRVFVSWTTTQHKTGEARLADVTEDASRQGNIVIYPNPFSDITNIEATFETARKVTIEVLDMNGKLVNTIFTGEVPAGISQNFRFDGSNLSAGFYVVRFVSEAGTEFRKISILRQQ